MSFKFSKTDDIESLPSQIRQYIPRYVDNRIIELNELKECQNNFALILDFCHKILGSARSYNLHQLEEITLVLQTCARQESNEQIEILFTEFESYLCHLKSISN